MTKLIASLGLLFITSASSFAAAPIGCELSLSKPMPALLPATVTELAPGRWVAVTDADPETGLRGCMSAYAPSAQFMSEEPLQFRLVILQGACPEPTTAFDKGLDRARPQTLAEARSFVSMKGPVLMSGARVAVPAKSVSFTCGRADLFEPRP